MVLSLINMLGYIFMLKLEELKLLYVILCNYTTFFEKINKNKNIAIINIKSIIL